MGPDEGQKAARGRVAELGPSSSHMKAINALGAAASGMPRLSGSEPEGVLSEIQPLLDR